MTAKMMKKNLLKTVTSRADRFINAAQRTPRQTIPFVNQKDDETTEVFIYDALGGGFFMDNPTAELVKEISAIETAEILVRINSPGGAVFDGVAIYNSLMQHDARVTTQIDGIAASIASVIAEAGEEITMLRGTQFMIHKPLMFAGGNADDFRQIVTLLDDIENGIVDIYRTRASLSDKAIRDAMEAETWYSPEDALDAGFVTAIADTPEAAENRFDLSAIFDNVPEDLRPDPTIRDIERMFRQGGVSRSKSERMAVAAIATLSSEGEPSGEHQGDPEIQASIERMNRILTE